MYRSILKAAGAGLFLLAISATAEAAAILVCNTGQTTACSGTLPDLSIDPNYTIVQGPFGADSTRVIDSSAFPISPFGPWLPNDSNSKWIGPARADTHGNDGTPANPLATPYRYQTTFDLSGLDPTTAMITGRWSTDDVGLNIYINGIATGQTTAGFTSYSQFVIASGFQSGLNTLTFEVLNSGGAWTGLRVDDISGTANPVPEPSTLALLGAGVAGLIRRRRKATWGWRQTSN